MPLEDLVLERVQPLTGTVVDEQGKAVPNAVIKTIWQKRKNSMSSAAFDMAVADENGRFQLNATTQTYDFGITARCENLATPETRIITPQDERKPLELVVSKEGVFDLQGTVIADDGKGIPNASISLKQALSIPDGNVYGEFPVFKNVECKTDRDGKFEFPIRLSRTAKYSIGVQAKGYMAAETPMLSVERDQGLLQPLPIKLAQTRFASGVVVDTNGKPVTDATVQSFAAVKRDAPGESRIVVKSDEEGRFELNNVHPSCNLCFVSKPGYRFQGAAYQIHRTGSDRRLRLQNSHRIN